MAELVARGVAPGQEWRRTLPAETISLGRTDKSVWDLPWRDSLVSSVHAFLTWRDGKLHVRRRAEARNPIIFNGEERDEFTLVPGEQFVIGDTTFLVQETAPDEPRSFSELTCSTRELRQVEFVDPGERISVLVDLPAVIRHSPSEEELGQRVVEVLLRGIPRAEAAAVVWLNPDAPAGQPSVEVHHARSRMIGTKPLQPSDRLVADAVSRRLQSVMHIWSPGALDESFTQDPSFDWALCVPLTNDSSSGWGLYVAGRLLSKNLGEDLTVDHNLLKSDLKFAELVAEIYAALRQVLDLQGRQRLLSRFLSPQVLVALPPGKDMDEVLKPRQAEVTVLFCDLRGSCRIAEQGRTDLMALWDRVSEALDVMASSIIEQDGVVGDFQGDAAMGFWGWPLASSDAVEKAARAALNIRRRFFKEAQKPGRALAGFGCGIGIATGPAVAGRLGTLDQFKVDVFGPTVNLAARLETMTKLLRVPIVVDEVSAQRLPPAGAWTRCRRLARLRPYGMTDTVLTVSELLAPPGDPAAMKENDRKNYEAALEAFQDGRWPDAAALLQRLPTGDGPTQFLKAYMDRQRKPPREWDKPEEKGVITMESK